MLISGQFSFVFNMLHSDIKYSDLVTMTIGMKGANSIEDIIHLLLQEKLLVILSRRCISSTLLDIKRT